jgi:LysR family transcriptional regulator, positive regulator for ilvC
MEYCVAKIAIRPVDLDVLRQFLHLSRTLHFGQASRQCHISPSALSRSIQRLEEQLGARLLLRDNRKVELTPAGVQLQRYASETLASFDRLREQLARKREHLSGTLSLFCSVTAAHSFLPTLLSRFREAYPDVTLRLETGYAVSALQMLQDDAVDVTVAALPERVPSSLLSRAITATPLLFVAPRAECEVSRMIERDPIDWVEVPLVLPESGVARRSVDSWFRREGITPRVYGEVSGNEAALSLISLGCGVGIVPRLVMDKSPLRVEVRSLDVRPRLPDFQIGVCTKRKNLASPVVLAFWESISESSSGVF